ncbi:hypothetical protein MTO96_041554, partial [Rhipicephalus appendiculatus]
PELVDSKKEDGYTSLHLAAVNNDYNLAKLLLTKGRCTVDLKNRNQQTALRLAVHQGFCELAELLVEAGADINQPDSAVSAAAASRKRNGYVSSEETRDTTTDSVDGDELSNDNFEVAMLAAKRRENDYIPAGCFQCKCSANTRVVILFASVEELKNLLLTGGKLGDIAHSSEDVLQIGFVNPTQYFFEFYLSPKLTYVKVRALMTSRSVDALHFIPLLTGTQVLGLVGGYSGFWMGVAIVVGATESVRVVFDFCRRRVRGRLRKAEITFLFRVCKMLMVQGCFVACAFSIYWDYENYRHFYTAVTYEQQNIRGVFFPAVTICSYEA